VTPQLVRVEGARAHISDREGRTPAGWQPPGSCKSSPTILKRSTKIEQLTGKFLRLNRDEFNCDFPISDLLVAALTQRFLRKERFWISFRKPRRRAAKMYSPLSQISEEKSSSHSHIQRYIVRIMLYLRAFTYSGRDTVGGLVKSTGAATEETIFRGYVTK
jgi:hypothetical protein